MFTSGTGNVAIVGGGLAGLSLALNLHANSIPCKIYELRPPTTKSTGALMLSPNSLRILDSMGVYSKLQTGGYNFENVTYKTAEGVTTDQYPLGSEARHGYKCLRIYRQTLLDELRSEMEERGISIEYGKNYSHVVSESEQGVTFAFKDGSEASASLLIGADGIHSKVRQYISPSTVPIYGGLIAITYALQKSGLRLPTPDYPLPASIHGQNGAFVLAPQNTSGEEIFAGIQYRYPEQNRAGWERLAADKQQLRRILQDKMEDWPDLVQSALENIADESLSIWAFYTMPKLASWTSTGGKVLLLGDSAHAIPPTAGQGASQAFEDAFALAVLLAKLPENVEMAEALRFWEESRKERIDRVLELTRKVNNARMPIALREKLGKDDIWHAEEGGLDWLYDKRADEDVRNWLEQHS